MKSSNSEGNGLTSSQRALIGAKMRVTSDLSLGKLARMHGVSGGLIAQACVVIAKGLPELLEAVESGAMPVTMARLLAQQGPIEQRAGLAARFAKYNPAPKEIIPLEWDSERGGELLARIAPLLSEGAFLAITDSESGIRLDTTDLPVFETLDDETLRQVIELFVARKWPVQQAMQFLAKGINGESTISDLVTWSLANPSKLWAETINGTEISALRR